MVGAVIVTHGLLARELLDAAERIVGRTEAIRAVSMDWDDDVADARQEIQAAINEVDAGAGVLIFTDMFGGTPTNVSLAFLAKDQVEIITGVNLPMIIKLTSVQNSDASLLDIAQDLRERGQTSIYVASEILSSRQEA
ncbi:MAG TPA: PTS sugar transporter subunit IIA [Acidobacteriota bacterium]|jgi:PTS system mannose-specific IIA component